MLQTSLLTTAFLALGGVGATPSLTGASVISPGSADDARARASRGTLAAVPPLDRVEAIRDLNGKVIGDSRAPELALGGNLNNPYNPRVQARAYLYGTWEVTLSDTGTIWQETFLIGKPKIPLSPAPLLVMFHGWGNSHWDIAVNTHYFQKAMARGWMVVAPMGAHKFNFSIDYSQQNTEAVLGWVLDNFNIDRTRIYGVGFSMGGGCASTYAARHLDPDHARFAAIVDHTGTVSIEDVWTNSTNHSILENELMFQGPPTQYPFRYQQASVIDLDASGNIDPDADLARNLIRTPMRAFAVSGDPNAHLVNQTSTVHSHLIGLGSNPELEIDSGNQHAWTTLNEDSVLTWLASKQLTDPTPGTSVRVLADRDANWHGFEIEQNTSNVFTPFRWTIDLVNNRLVLDQVKNMASVAFTPREVGLEFFAVPTIEVMINLVGQTNLEIILEGYSQPPASVSRTGGSGSWTWDPGTETITLHETNGTGYPRWTVTQ